MEMTVQDLRDYVRNSLEVDEEELMDMLLDTWMNEGIAHVQAPFEPWRFFEATWSLTTASASIDFADITDVDTVLESISSVLDVDYPLKPLPHATALRQFAWSNNSTRPIAFSEHEDKLFLWPVPDATYSYTIIGYRVPMEAMLATDMIDLPTVFHPLIAEWMLARAYERDDDEIMSEKKFNRVDQQIDLLKRRFKRTPKAGIQVLGGNRTASAVPLGCLRFDWEI